uniref:Uncharacterized protein n=1 Tax=Pipistrellus kuhlii TaxID=59472 RepID=A0A7J7SFU3_PIPKU|nr:hypothetical protein mPipKuh1_009963 [Pipistrellus kuhlii]
MNDFLNFTFSLNFAPINNFQINFLKTFLLILHSCPETFNDLQQPYYLSHAPANSQPVVTYYKKSDRKFCLTLSSSSCWKRTFFLLLPLDSLFSGLAKSHPHQAFPKPLVIKQYFKPSIPYSGYMAGFMKCLNSL